MRINKALPTASGGTLNFALERDRQFCIWVL